MTSQSILVALIIGFSISSCKKEKSITAYYPNGKVKSIWRFDIDTLNGTKDVYWENGNLSYRFNYSRGKRNGGFLTFYKNGFPAEKGTFSNGLRHGLFFEYSAADSSNLKSEAYIIPVNGTEYYYFLMEFNSEGSIVKDQRFLTVVRDSQSDVSDVLLEYVGNQPYDSMNVVIANYNDQFEEADNSSDTISFVNRIAVLSGDHSLLRNEFLRGRFFGFRTKTNGDTVFNSTDIKFFEERVKMIPVKSLNEIAFDQK